MGLTAGCYSYRPVAAPAASARPLLRARAVLADGRVLLLRGARVEGDSLVGDLDADLPAGAPRRVAVALGALRSVEAERFDAGLTAGRVGAAAAVYLVVVIAAAYAFWGGIF